MTVPRQGFYCDSGIFNDRSRAGVLLLLWNILWPFQGRCSTVTLEYFNDRSKAGVLL